MRPPQPGAPKHIPSPEANRPAIKAAPSAGAQRSQPEAPISTPHQPTAQQVRRPLITKKIIIIAGIVIFLVAAGLILRQLVFASNNNLSKNTEAPEYQTILPSGKAINELGGWKRVSPPGKDAVFAYADIISGVPVSVSEQPLPQSLQENTDEQVAKIAEKFNATQKIDANETTVYLGTSAKGPQSAIFTKNDLLIMIKSQKKISNKAWASYITSLK